MISDLSSGLLSGLRKLVIHNGRVQAGERVVVVTDANMEPIADSLLCVLGSIAASVKKQVIPRRERDGQEPPDEAAAAMAEADVIFTPVSRSITHTRAMKVALNNGARAILMTAHHERVLSCDALLTTNFEQQAPECHMIAAALRNGCMLRVSSPKGTDLRIPIQGRPVNVLTGIPRRGELAPVPTIEVNVVPEHGKAEGVLIADGSIPYLGIGVLTEPVVCEVRAGYITSIKGGAQAAQFAAILKSHGHPECYNVAELGIGLNPHAKLTGFMLEDEGVFGSIHVGIGTSLTLGGEIVAPTHYDLIALDARLEIDGRLVMQDRMVVA